MEEPPRSIKERLFTRKVLLRSVFIGVIIAVGAIIGCLNVWAAGGWHIGMAVPSDWFNFEEAISYQRLFALKTKAWQNYRDNTEQKNSPAAGRRKTITQNHPE